MRDSGPDWWDSWIRGDLDYTPTPYEQLAAAYIMAGDRGAADEIHYLSRVRQRDAEREWWPWIRSGFLEYGAGFGIGKHMFQVLWLVVAISAVGAVYLRKYVPEAGKQGFWWCFGASFARLLPVIEINKEFSDFFNDPERKRLTRRQTIALSTFPLLGFILGAILIAAVSGLTEKP
jgi:hypothetical protein